MDLAKVKAFLELLGERADREGPSTLSEHELNVLVPWFAVGVIGNGGFAYWFDGSYPLSDVARRFRLIGCDSEAHACERALAAVFSNGLEPLDPAARRKATEHFDWSIVSDSQKVLLRVDPVRLLEAIGRYIENNQSTFESKPLS